LRWQVASILASLSGDQGPFRLSASELSHSFAGSEVAATEQQTLWREAEVWVCGSPKGGNASGARQKDHQGAYQAVTQPGIVWPSELEAIALHVCCNLAALA
jgi:hypothetical protein